MGTFRVRVRFILAVEGVAKLLEAPAVQQEAAKAAQERSSKGSSKHVDCWKWAAVTVGASGRRDIQPRDIAGRRRSL